MTLCVWLLLPSIMFSKFIHVVALLTAELDLIVCIYACI